MIVTLRERLKGAHRVITEALDRAGSLSQLQASDNSTASGSLLCFCRQPNLARWVVQGRVGLLIAKKFTCFGSSISWPNYVNNFSVYLLAWPSSVLTRGMASTVTTFAIFTFSLFFYGLWPLCGLLLLGTKVLIVSSGLWLLQTWQIQRNVLRLYVGDWLQNVVS